LLAYARGARPPFYAAQQRRMVSPPKPWRRRTTRHRATPDGRLCSSQIPVLFEIGRDTEIIAALVQQSPYADIFDHEQPAAGAAAQAAVTADKTMPRHRLHHRLAFGPILRWCSGGGRHGHQ